MPRDISTLLSQDKVRLQAALGLDSGEARIEVQMLLQRTLEVARAYLLAHPEQVLNASQEDAYDALLQRRLQGEPIAYILGEREFFGLNFKVSPATLIPRPDTELLVELALQRIPASPAPDRTPSHSARPADGQGAAYLPLGGRQGGREFRVLDLGTGSGAIALSIAHARSDVEVVGVDASPAALAVARENAGRLNLRNVCLLHSNWFSALGAQRFDLIVSNPPYVAADDAHLMRGDVRFEPASALASGKDGLDDIRCISAQAGGFLKQGGCLLIEHGYDQAVAVRNLLQQNGFTAVFSAKDIAGIERVSGGVVSR